MTCTWQAKLDAYVDAELQAGELAEFDTRLRRNPSCAAETLGPPAAEAHHARRRQRYQARPEFRLNLSPSFSLRTCRMTA
jgi:anti-sigma factor RsiW